MVWLLCFLLTQSEILSRYEDILMQQFSPHLYESYKNLAFQSGEVEKFLKFSHKLLVLNPENPEIITGIAEGDFRLGEKSEGMKYLESLFKKQPEEVRRIGPLLRRWGMEREAIRFYERYRKRRKESCAYAFEIASISEDLGDYKRATLEMIKLLNKSDNPYYERTLVSYISKVDPDFIIKKAKGIKRERTRSKVLARLYLSLQRYEDVEKELKKIPQRELSEFARIAWEEKAYPLAASLYGRLGDCINQARALERAGRVEEAIKALERDDSPAGIMERARLYLSAHNFEKASHLYERVKGNPQAIYGLTKAYIGMGELDKAEELLRGIREPTDKTLFWLFKINLFKKNFDSAQTYINRLAIRYPESPLLNDALEYGVLISMRPRHLGEYIQAMLLYEIGEYEKGIEILRKIISSNGELSTNAYLLLAQFYKAEDRPSLSISAYKELKERFPKSPLLPKALLEEALLYRDLKNEKRYRETLRELVLNYPTSPQAPIARELLESLGKTPMP